MKNILVFCFLIGTVNAVSGQINKDQNDLTYEMVLQVKQLNQFIDRFNYKKDIHNQDIDSVFREKMPREKYLRTLFNVEDERFRIMDSNNSINIKSEMEKFISSVNNNQHPQYLSYQDNQLFALARSVISFKGTDQEISLLLQLRVEKDQSSQWYIIGIPESPFSMNMEVDQRKKNIPPNSNETNFISISRLLNDSLVRFGDLIYPDHTYDPLSVFWYCLENKTLSFEHVIKITYYFFQIKDWVFTVDEFSRNSWNSGWLISDIYSAPDQSKDDFFYEAFNTKPVDYSNKIPEVISLYPYSPCPGDQQDLKTSVAWASAYHAMTMMWAVDNGIKNQENITDSSFSPSFVFNLLSDEEGCGVYTDINRTLYFLKHTGTVKSMDIRNDCNVTLDERLYQKALKYRINDYYELFRASTSDDLIISSIKHALKMKKPVLVEFNAPDSFEDVADSLWFPKMDEDENAFHQIEALTIIGFDDRLSSGAFEVLYSRGTKWGINGRAWIRYSDFVKYARKGFFIK
ncbi:MAG: hypothetical protein KQI35_14315 [Bacteroidetes bacterium]|nr:hypothetical protein [Bacteroidota bacterium]